MVTKFDKDVLKKKTSFVEEWQKEQDEIAAYHSKMRKKIHEVMCVFSKKNKKV